MLEHAASGLDPGRFTRRFHRDSHGNLLVLGDLMKIDVQNLPGERVVLHFLHQDQPGRVGVSFDCQINQDGLGNGVMNQIFDLLEPDLEVLRLGSTPVNDGRDASTGAQFSDAAAFGQGAWKDFQRQ